VDTKTNLILTILAVCVVSVLTAIPAEAHFGMIIPDKDIVEEGKDTEIDIKIMFVHPFEGVSMNMEKPVQCGVIVNGNKEDLLPEIIPYDVKLYGDVKSFQGWQTEYKIKRPGDYLFFVEPAPYWEPVEDCYIVHYTKVIVDAFGWEEGWDTEIGLKTEIVPLTRPFGIYAGNVFQGIVKVNGVKVPNSEVEVEYYNESGEYTAPKGSFVTQVIKCDSNGVFTYAIPKAGWWGFAALNEAEDTIEYEGEQKPVEIGAVLWLKAYDME
jgi:nickel transport protein